MNHPAVIVLVVAVVILVAAAAYFYSRQRRSKLLREHFGPEYDRVVRQENNVRRAEGVLEFREQAREPWRFASSHVPIRPLLRSIGMQSNDSLSTTRPEQLCKQISW